MLFFKRISEDLKKIVLAGHQALEKFILALLTENRLNLSLF
jgi:hypothetical protein